MQIKKKRGWIIGLGILAIILLIIIGSVVWYKLQLRPVDPENQETTLVTIKSGATPDTIANDLKQNSLIRSSLAFSIHAKINNLANGLQAGGHKLSPSQSTPEIAKQLQQAENNDIVVQFVPGAMLIDNSKSTPNDKKQDVRSTLERLGYDRGEIEQAFEADYSEYKDTLFKGRPENAGIEGYAYGETYNMSSDATVEQILRRSFDEFAKVVKDQNLEQKFAEHGLTLYQGITLASIIQKEVSCHGSQVCDDQKQVSQVFFKRLADNMPLGADATFVYAAAQTGQTPTIDLDSPYNTRIHSGLTPGPISSPGLGALTAVANPAQGDYLYFVSGDDGTNYFSRTMDEHVEATKKYCIKNCVLPE